jgi:hypothetical protein
MRNEKRQMENALGLWPEKLRVSIEARTYFEMGGNTYFYGREQHIFHLSFVIVRR